MDTTLQQHEVQGVKVELRRLGAGPALLYLHGHMGLWKSEAFLEQLAQHFTVFAPSAPGFEGSPTVDRFTSVDELSYLYLDLMEQLDLRDVTLVGSSMGGWLAQAIAVKDSSRISALALLNATGVHFGGPEEESVADIFSMAEEDFVTRGFAVPDIGRKNYAEWSDAELLTSSRNREAAARYGWMPCMYDPKLLQWLHRIKVKTLVLWGEADRITASDYGRKLADHIPGAAFEVISGAGHFPHMELPQQTADRLAQFAGADASSRSAA